MSDNDTPRYPDPDDVPHDHKSWPGHQDYQGGGRRPHRAEKRGGWCSLLTLMLVAVPASLAIALRKLLSQA